MKTVRWFASLPVSRLKANKKRYIRSAFRFQLLAVFLLLTTLSLYHCTTLFASWGATVPNPIMEYNYTYDNNGNITDIYNAVTVSTTTFTYDEVDRLTSAIGPYGTQSYSYDAVGNIQGVTEPTKDANGNATDYNKKHIDYDYENRPIFVANLNIGQFTEFAYDYSGQRVYKIVYNIAYGYTITTETYYVGNIYEESYTTGPGPSTASASSYVYAGSTRVVGLTTQTSIAGTENNTCYYHGDHLGSSSIITDEAGTVVRDISYQPWGNVNSNTQAPGASTNYNPPYKFTGQILDDSTGLYYYGARYYDPVLRRFITPDTIVQSPYDPQSLNRYAYCRNNPLIYTDPSGNSWASETWRRNKVPITNVVGAIVTAATAVFSGGQFVLTFGYDTSGEQNVFHFGVYVEGYAFYANQENQKWSAYGQGSWNFSRPSSSSNNNRSSSGPSYDSNLNTPYVPYKVPDVLNLNPVQLQYRNGLGYDPSTSYLIFDQTEHRLAAYTDIGNPLGSWEAYNNVDSRSRGIWPDGEYSYQRYNRHPESGVNDSYGSHGILIFDVAGRIGMGVHSGRANRQGAASPTMGCIRTTDEAMGRILSIHGFYPINSIVVW